MNGSLSEPWSDVRPVGCPVRRSVGSQSRLGPVSLVSVMRTESGRPCPSNGTEKKVTYLTTLFVVTREVHMW